MQEHDPEEGRTTSMKGLRHSKYLDRHFVLLTVCLAASVSAGGQTETIAKAGQQSASTAPVFTTLVSFDGIHGLNPSTPLIQGNDGNFYGTTPTGGANSWGTIFQMTPEGTLTTFYNFCNQTSCTDGANPEAGLVQGNDGNFYGTTVNGGEVMCVGQCSGGTVFTLTPSGALTTLYSFATTGNPAGSNPQAPLVQGSDGNFYGTTYDFGSNCIPYAPACGSVFKITSSGTLNVLHSFGLTDGGGPSGLIQATDGNFYGTTFYGGPNVQPYGGSIGGGTVFRIAPDGTFATIHNFCLQPDCADGSSPYSGLVQGSDGYLYGTTAYGGANCNSLNGNQYSAFCGTIFKITLGGELTTLWQFCSATSSCGTNGERPFAGLVQGTDGDFYGTTYGSGAGPGEFGTIFKITPAGVLTTLYDFCSQPNCADGFYPQGTLVQGRDGKFYGTTTAGGIGTVRPGAGGDGTVFSLGLSSTGCAVDVSSQVTVLRGGFRFNHATNSFVETVTLSNNGGTLTNVSLVLDGLSSGATLSNPGGKTQCDAPLGSPWITVTGALGSGQSATATLTFSDPAIATIQYATRVLAGTGQQ